MANYKDIIENCKSTKGGIIETFHALQKEFNYIPQEALVEAAGAFGLSEAQAYGVATSVVSRADTYVCPNNPYTRLPTLDTLMKF